MPRNSDARQCSARSKRSGKRCRKYAIPGATVCSMHGGNSGLVRRKAAERLAETKVRREMERLGMPVETDVGTALVSMVYESAGALAYLRGLVQELGAKTAPARDAIYGPDHLGDLQPHVILKLYNEERDRLARFSRMALDAGVDQREIRLQEKMGEKVAWVVTTVLDSKELDLSVDQRRAGRMIAGEHLRRLAGELGRSVASEE